MREGSMCAFLFCMWLVVFSTSIFYTFLEIKMHANNPTSNFIIFAIKIPK